MLLCSWLANNEMTTLFHMLAKFLTKLIYLSSNELTEDSYLQMT